MKMYKIRHSKEAIKKAIELAGGARSLAEKAGVSYQTILNWKLGKFSPNPSNCIEIEKAVNKQVTRSEILPGFPWSMIEEEK
jgi:DNA-binding transcriptional regulator YdaS (Cro superfamily)